MWACDENGAMTRDPREIFQSRGGERGEAAADGAADEGSDPFAFDTFKTYGTAKQAATALTLTLARKTRAAHGDSIVVHACTPGMVRTNLSRFMHPLAFLRVSAGAVGAHQVAATGRVRAGVLRDVDGRGRARAHRGVFRHREQLRGRAGVKVGAVRRRERGVRGRGVVAHHGHVCTARWRATV